MKSRLSRRAFLATTVATGMAVAQAPAPEKEKTMSTPQVCIFSKHLQFLDYAALAKTCKEIGLDGVDLTVRKVGHVLPENVATDLPRAVEAIRSAGLDVPMITTALCAGDDPTARPILEAAAKQGIRYFRIGGQKYAPTGDPFAQLEGFTEEVRGLVTLAQEFNMVVGYHNHSGYGNVAGPLWDLHWMIEQIGSDNFGSNFDVGHAKVEGAFGAWETNARLLAAHVKMMAVKDFVWENGKPSWGTLGKGLVDLVGFMKVFHEVGFAGPISIHMEYKTPSNEALIEEIRQAALTLRAALVQAGY